MNVVVKIFLPVMWVSTAIFHDVERRECVKEDSPSVLTVKLLGKQADLPVATDSCVKNQVAEVSANAWYPKLN
jgi:hypothetical protein